MGPIPPGTDLTKVPLFPHPNGDPPNFIDPPSLYPTVLGVGIALITLSACCVGLRLFANLRHTGKIGLDDIFCVSGELGGIAYWAIIFILARDTASTHSWDVPASAMTSASIKLQFVQQVVFAPVMWLVKAAILALYIRVLDSVRWLRITAYGLIVFTGLFYMSNVIIAFVYCIPRNGAPWDGTLYAKCSDPVTATAALVSGAFGVVVDLVIFALPLPIIFGLHLTGRDRIGLIGVFLVASLIVVTGVVSLAYRIKYTVGNDPMWNGLNVLIAAFSEVFGTVIVSCAPAISSFWKHVFTKTKLYSSIRNTIFSQKSQGTVGHDTRSEPKYGSETNLQPKYQYAIGKHESPLQYSHSHFDLRNYKIPQVTLSGYSTKSESITESKDSISIRTNQFDMA